MGKPEIVEITTFYSDDDNREASISFGESDLELYKLSMVDKKEGRLSFLFFNNLQEAENKADEFVRYEPNV